jgi:hypothetical protein
LLVVLAVEHQELDTQVLTLVQVVLVAVVVVGSQTKQQLQTTQQ